MLACLERGLDGGAVGGRWCRDDHTAHALVCERQPKVGRHSGAANRRARIGAHVDQPADGDVFALREHIEVDLSGAAHLRARQGARGGHATSVASRIGLGVRDLKHGGSRLGIGSKPPKALAPTMAKPSVPSPPVSSAGAHVHSPRMARSPADETCMPSFVWGVPGRLGKLIDASSPAAPLADPDRHSW
mmetsp:Transcript_5392/g.14194  ORF Transcript_5392/g.14194 Transcript_5392/m.14194 type:complete len:189 (+) Transcript_5392:902-1468(+)